jgi:hypothetical protein
MSSVAPSRPEQGQLVNVRQRHYAVTEVARSTLPASPLHPSDNAAQHLVSLSSVEEDALGEELQVIWNIEPGAQMIEKEALSAPCPACFPTIRVSDDILGKKIGCPKCGAVLVAKRIGERSLLQLASVSRTTATRPQDVKDDDGSVPLPAPANWSKGHGESIFVVCPVVFG